jgi:hypothetical protein
MSSSTNIVADYYCVSHIAAATIPSSRLSDILARMHQGRPLTKHSLDFLQQQNLPGLYLLACGETTHDAYISGLDPASLSRHQAAKVANEAKETERQALAAHYRVRKTNHHSGSTPKKMIGRLNASLRRKREREADEAALKLRKMRQAEWKAQRERNCEQAAATLTALARSPIWIYRTDRPGNRSLLPFGTCLRCGQPPDERSSNGSLSGAPAN